MANLSDTPANPHFFQPLLPDFQFDFSIPRSFHKYLDIGEDDEKGIEVTLRNRFGKAWKVKISANNKRFKDGWENFCQDQELKVGDFLVFNYIGDLVFDVWIFDHTACERGFLDFDDDGHDLDTELKVPKDVAINASKGLSRNGKKKGIKKVNLKRESALTPSGHGRPFFKTVVKPYAIKSGAMNIPVEFAREHNLYKRWCDLIIIDEKEESWPMLLRCSPSNSPYIGGWRRFHKGQGLHIGESVTFELLCSGDQPSFKFHRSKSRVKREINGLEEKAPSEPTGHSYCRLVVQPYWRKKSTVYLPSEFSRENGLDNRRCEIVIIDEKGKAWTLQLGKQGDRGTGYISRWAPFHDANSLHTGDRVMLHLIHSGPKPVFKFSAY